MENLIHLIETYFIGERIESVIFIVTGCIALLLASFFLFIIKYSFFKGMAIPFLVIGLLQLSVGINVYNLTLKGIERVSHLMKQDSQKLKTVEIPRMKKVLKNFTIYKWIEISLIACALILFIKFYSSPQTYWKGLALGLLIQTSIMLSLDIVAEQRGEIYFEKLQEINKP